MFPGDSGAAFYSPHFLPGAAGGRVLVAGRGTRSQQAPQLIDLRSAKAETTRAAGAYASYTASGYILFQAEPRKPAHWALPVSPRTKKPVGEAFPIRNTGADVSTSVDGTLVWCDSPIDENLGFVWRDRAGKKTGLPGSASVLYAISTCLPMRLVWLSPRRSKVTTMPEFRISPARPRAAGKEIAFGSLKSGQSDIYIQSADGSGEPKAIRHSMNAMGSSHPTGGLSCTSRTRPA